MASDWLPKSIVLRAAIYDAYAHYESGEVDAGSGTAFDPLSVIDVEVSKRGTGNYFHLRFRYTNKYWSVNSDDRTSILAVATQPVDEVTDPNSTLFCPVLGMDGNIRMTHVYTGKFVRRSTTNTRLYVDVMEDGFVTLDYAFRFINSDSIVRIPRTVVFQGDNGLYLQGFWYSSYPYLRYSGDDINRLDDVGQEVSLQRDGFIRIKSNYFGKFWRCGNNWVEVDADDVEEDIETWFWPVKLDSGTIALRADRNNRFCHRLTADIKESCLNTSLPIITEQAKIVVKEAVLERSIDNVEYQLEDARVFREEPLVLTSLTAENEDITESTSALKFSHEITNTYSFNKAVSATVGVETTIKTKWIRIVEGKIKLSSSVTGTLVWEKQEQEKKTIEATYTAKVPARSRVTVNCIATRGKCSVPFRYTQRDKRSSDGEYVVSQHADGIFEGVSYYNITYQQHGPQPIDD